MKRSRHNPATARPDPKAPIQFIRSVSEDEAIAIWAAAYLEGKHKGYGTDVVGLSENHRGKSPVWVEVAIPHNLYDADWNNEDTQLSDDQEARARRYAASVGRFPPGMASFRKSSKSGKAYISDGNHRAYASFLRGEPTARFLMPLPDYERYVAYLTTPKTNPATARRTDPALWERVKAEVTASDKGGRPGQWSARKAQFAVAEYKARGGGYIGPKTPDNSLVRWTKEEWRTRSGLPSLETGERYLPARAITALTASEYAATSAKKRAGMRRGQQFVPQPESVAMKTSKYRRNPPNPRTVTQVTKAAREALGDPTLEFVRGDGYFYVLYGETGMTDGFAYGGRVSAQSLDRWVREIREAIAKAER